MTAGRAALPLRLARFLDLLTGAGLLRLTATSYQFRHQEFLVWLEGPADGRPAAEMLSPAADTSDVPEVATHFRVPSL